jgi:hypothetical protein
MNSEENPTGQDTQAAVAGYCRVCGKALSNVEARTVQGIIYCADHIPRGAPPPPPPNSPFPGSPYAAPPQAATGSPGLAFVLGLIPGVGAIYNSQYAKGLVHVVIFGLLCSILEQGAGGLEPLFGMLLAAWIFYMAFEAYHTAKKRQLGQTVDEFSSLFPHAGRAGSKAGPIVLIAAGVLFLLITLDVIRLYAVVKFWPVLLIALGAYLLWVRIADERAKEELSHE